VLTSAGEELMRVAQRMENEVFGLNRELLGKDARLSGPLRLATTDAIAVLHAADFADFVSEHPGVDLEVAVDVSMHNLSRREADVVMRATNNPPEHLFGRRVAAMRWGPLAAPSLVDRIGSGAPMSAWPWVCWDPRKGIYPASAWLDRVAPDRRNVLTVDSDALLLEMVLNGTCAAFMISANLVRHPSLCRIGPWRPELDFSLWLLTHPDLKDTARVRAFMDFMAPRAGALHAPPDGESADECG
jgi:DNA-binding transcriptional LysR family regulator